MVVAREYLFAIFVEVFTRSRGPWCSIQMDDSHYSSETNYIQCFCPQNIQVKTSEQASLIKMPIRSSKSNKKISEGSCKTWSHVFDGLINGPQSHKCDNLHREYTVIDKSISRAIFRTHVVKRDYVATIYYKVIRV